MSDSTWVTKEEFVPAPLVFEGTSDEAVLPTRGHWNDAGLDLYCSADVEIPAGSFARVGTDVRVELRDAEWGLLLGRSSTLAEFGLLVAPGVIDPDYRGELMIAVQNLTDKPVQVCKGQRIAQFILMDNRTVVTTPVWGLVDQVSSRGGAGFGSTGS